MDSHAGIVFVVNVPRSGSTLMQVMLSSHPEICICPETRIVDRIVRKWAPDEELGAAGRERIERILEGDDKLQGWQMPRFEFADHVADAGAARPRRLIEAVFARYRDAINPGARIVGLKKGSLLQQWRKVLTYWPGARFIFTVRDPRASITSSVANLPHRMLLPETLKWRQRVKAARALASHAPETVLFVRYEDWMASPDATMREVCEFVGVDFDIRMTRFQDHNRDYRMIAKGMEGIHRNTTRGLRGDRVDGWRNETPPWRARLLRSMLAGDMADLGYGRDGDATP